MGAPELTIAEESFLRGAIEARLQTEIAEPMRRLLGDTLKPTEAGETYAVAACGRFSGSRMVDLLAHAQYRKLSGALVVTDGDAERVIFLANGAVTGAASSVLFERLGRLLYNAEVVTHEDSNTLVDAEEQHGAGALLLWLSGDQLDWAIERRVWELGGALALVKRGHFVFVEGEPNLDGPRMAIEPKALAREGERAREQLRSGTMNEGDSQPTVMRDPPAAAKRPLRPLDLSKETINEILERIREADGSPGT